MAMAEAPESEQVHGPQRGIRRTADETKVGRRPSNTSICNRTEHALRRYKYN